MLVVSRDRPELARHLGGLRSPLGQVIDAGTFLAGRPVPGVVDGKLVQIAPDGRISDLKRRS